MSEQYVTRFRAGTPEQRRSALIKLGNSADSRALPLLEEIAAGEPDPTLRSLALKAAQHIRSQQQKSSSADALINPAPQPTNAPLTKRDTGEVAASPSVYSFSGYTYESKPQAEPELEVPAPDLSKVYGVTGDYASDVPLPVTPQVSEQDQRKAKDKIDQAISWHVSRQDDKALKLLGEAAKIDPGTLKNPTAINLAMMITNLDRDEAINYVRDAATSGGKGGRSGGGGSGAAGGGGKSVHIDRPGRKFGDELFQTVVELLGLFAFFFVICTIGLLAIQRVLTPLLSKIQQQGLSAALPSSLSTLTIPGSILLQVALESALGIWIAALVYTIFVYVIGTFLGGTGEFFRFLRVMARGEVVLFGVGIVLVIAFVLVLLSSIGQQNVNSSDPASVRILYNTISNTFGNVFIFILVATFVIDSIEAFIISRAHNFSVLRGAMTSIAVWFLISCASFAITESQLVSNLNSQYSQIGNSLSTPNFNGNNNVFPFYLPTPPPP